MFNAFVTRLTPVNCLLPAGLVSAAEYDVRVDGLVDEIESQLIVWRQ